jgi:hypothetical protein
MAVIATVLMLMGCVKPQERNGDEANATLQEQPSSGSTNTTPGRSSSGSRTSVTPHSSHSGGGTEHSGKDAAGCFIFVSGQNDQIRPDVLKSCVAVNAKDVIPPYRRKIIIDLADRLTKHPDTHAYLIVGSVVEADGSRNILTIMNSAARQVYRDSRPLYGDSHIWPRQVYLEVSPPGIAALSKMLINNAGIAEGYRDDVFYQLNWDFHLSPLGNDINVLDRNAIIDIGTKLRPMPGNTQLPSTEEHRRGSPDLH